MEHSQLENQLTPKEINRRINLAQAHLAPLANSYTFRKEIEMTEELAQKEGNDSQRSIEAYWKLQDKLSRELANHLINYKGSSEATAYCLKLADILNGIETAEEKWYRIRENVKEFLREDTEISKSETLKNLTNKAINEDSMDGYYNLLKGFRKEYEEVVKIKGNEAETNAFLEKLMKVIYDRK